MEFESLNRWIRQIGMAVDRFWLAPTDARVYALIRIIFAIVTLINLIDLWPDRHAFFADSGMIDLQTTRDSIGSEPRFSIFYYATSELAVTAVFIVTAIALVGLTLGVLPRLCLLLIYVWLSSYIQRAFPIIHGWDQILRILALFLLISPVGKCWRLPTALGSRMQHKKNGQIEIVTERLPRYGLVLIQLQLFVVYWQSLWLKLADVHWRNGEYISYFMLSMYSRFPDPSWAHWQLASCMLTYGTLLLEVSVPVLLLIKRTRWLGFLLGVGLHLGILATSTLWLFSLVILIPYFAFLDDDDIARTHRWCRRFRSTS